MTSPRSKDMDKSKIKSFKAGIDKMRAKVIAVKGKSVEGLTPIETSKVKSSAVSSKTRESDI